MTLLCPECEGLVALDVDEAEEGDVLPCEDCGADLEIVSLSPPKLDVVDATGYDDPEETTFRSGEEEDDE